MKGLLSKVGGFFVELDETSTAQIPAAVSPAQTSSTVAQSVSSPTNMINQDMLSALQKVISNRKTPYTALVESSERLRNIIPDDVTRLKAAFATISADGARSLADVTKALDVHVQDLSGEQIKFKQMSDQAIANNVGSIRSQAKNLTDSCLSRATQISNLEAQIHAMTQQNIDDQAKSADLTNQANVAESEINAKVKQFGDAVEFIKNDLVNKKSQLASALA